ncbi:MAG: STAS domain-containing protein [Chitinispirillales bacterium]|jgi:anti-anti-sigma factor|nr:STAS domain-containing protein [Chitinispirillales bacterium]
MDIGRRGEHGLCIVDVVGKIDRLTDSNAMRAYIASLAENNEKMIAINLSQVTYMDSGALNVLVHIRNVVVKLGGELVLIQPNEYVYDVLHVVGFDKIITIYSSEKEFVDEAKKLKTI